MQSLKTEHNRKFNVEILSTCSTKWKGNNKKSNHINCIFLKFLHLDSSLLQDSCNKDVQVALPYRPGNHHPFRQN